MQAAWLPQRRQPISLIQLQGKRSSYWPTTVDQSVVIHLSWVGRDSPDVSTAMNEEIMRVRSFFRRVCAAALFALAGMALAGQVPKSKGSKRIFVVAVHDSSLFTLCPSAKMQAIQSPDGRIHPMIPGMCILSLPPPQLLLEPGMLDAERPDWPRFSQSMPNISPSGWIDSDLETKIEREFAKHKEYVLADSAENADFVFLLEGLYLSFQTVSINQARSGSGSASMVSYGKNGIGQNIVQEAMAIVVPAGVYRADPGDVSVLLKSRLWEGSVFMNMVAGKRASAPVETLVDGFVRNKRSIPDLGPVCAAWSMREPSTFPIDTPRQRATLKPAGSGLVMPPDGAPASSSDAFKVTVTLVTVPVIASDADGRYVADLTAGDFHLYEDGAEQRIDRVIPEEEPFHVALMMDVSGSTTIKHGDIQSAALAFLEALRPGDEVLVASFANTIQVASEFTNDRAQLRSAILQTPASGSTRLYDALELVVTRRLNRIQGRKAIVLLTDGVDTASRLSDMALSSARIQESDVLVYILQYDTRKDMKIFSQVSVPSYVRASEYLRDLSVISGGRRFDASSVPALREAFSEIADELRHQYTLCYYPERQKADSSLRRIQVKIDRPGVTARARIGYRSAAKR